MSRTVVSFELLGSDTVFKLEDAPIDIPDMGANKIVNVAPVTGDTIADRGRALLALLTEHPPVRMGLDAALQVPPGAGPAPLYFHMLATSADELPWELIYDEQHGFCVLDRRWPVGRIAKRRRPLKLRLFTPPLRIVAVLSAAGRSGLRQLEALLSAVASNDSASIGTSLHVISAEEAVLATAAARPGVTSETIAGTAPSLAEQIANARPDVLHLLCHGGAVAGVRLLAFATLADADAAESGEDQDGNLTGSLRLKVPDLLGALRACDPWLVVLSACDTADTAEGPALAHELAAGGIPAVVGMRRLVDLGDTNRFCAALYPEVLAAVRSAVEPAAPPTPREVDWAATLTVPRVTMAGADPLAVDAWTDPILYVQDDPLQVLPSAATQSPDEYNRLRAKLDFWEGYLVTIDPATAPDAFNYAMERITEIRASLAGGGRG